MQPPSDPSPPPSGESEPHAHVFALSRDRDAWAAIRGFVYQADLTILRWLELQDNEVLELERGEDIDSITGAVVGGAAELARLLEQIKRLSRKITLQSAVARASIANFLEHRRANRDGPALRFRFTSNAKPARERNSPIPGKLAGIDAWNLLRRGGESPADQDAFLRGLRALLKGGARPSDIPGITWGAYQSWLTTAADNDLLDFIRDFEWALGFETAEPLRARITRELVSRGLVAKTEEAELAYLRLFSAVFVRLSSPGIRRLSRNDLIVEIANPTSPDASVVARLGVIHEALERRVDKLQDRVDKIEGAVAVTSAQMQEMMRRAGISAELDVVRAIAPSLDEPIEVPRSSRRTKTVAALVASGPITLNLHGVAGCGKSQLALLISRTLGQKRAWIRFYDRSVDRATIDLGLAVDTILARADDPRRSSHDWRTRCEGVAAVVDALVLDGVPDVRAGDRLSTTLLPLVAACTAVGKPIILTSRAPLRVLEKLVRREDLAIVPSPPLDDDETREVLVAYGCPGDMASGKFPSTVCAITRGHPILVQAVGRYLEAAAWTAKWSVVEGIFKQTYADAVNPDTVKALLDGVGDSATRGLLYRLAMAREFTANDLAALATVQPEIDAPRERLTTLLGPWIEESRPGQYAVSPLVTALGDGDLQAQVRRGCHSVLARRIASRRKITELEAGLAITHFVQAEEHNSAAVFLVHGLHFLVGAPVEVAKESLLPAMWSDTALHASVDASVRFQIRALQVVLARRLNKDAAYALADIDVLLAEPSPVPAWSRLGGLMMLMLSYARERDPRALRFMQHAVRAWQEVEEIDRADLEATMPGGIASLAWITSACARTPGDLDIWFQSLAALPRDATARVFEGAPGREGAVFTVNQLTIAEYRKTTRDWVPLGDYLRDLRDRAETAGVTALSAAAQGGRISCLGEGGAKWEDVEEESKTALRVFTDPDLAFQIAKATALAALDRGFSEAARRWLETADSTPGRLYRHDRVHVKIRLAAQVIGNDPSRAVDLCAAAVEAAKALPLPSAEVDDEDEGGRNDLLITRCHGELAIARWAAGDRNGTARAVIESISGVLDHEDQENLSWKALCVRIGHIAGYYSSMLRSGSPPDHAADGEPYSAPKPGMFIALDGDLHRYFDARRFAVLGVLAMELALAIGDDDAAAIWAKRGASSAEALGLWSVAAIPLRHVALFAVLAGDVSGAIDAAIKSTAAMYLARREAGDRPDVFAVTRAPRDVLGARAGDEKQVWSNVNDVVLPYVVIPAFIRVASRLRGSSDNAGKAAAAELREACDAEAVDTTRRDVTDESISDDPWAEAARLVADVFERGVGRDTLIKRAQAYLRREGFAFRALGALAYVGASLDPNAPLSQSASIHVAIGQYLHSGHVEPRGLYERIVLPFLVSYWETEFERARFRFSSPAMVVSRLRDAAARPASSRLQGVLEAIADGLSITVLAEARAWMRGPARPA